MNREQLIQDIQERYRQSGRVLNELERRHWAAQEAIKLGRGGITIVCRALRISPNTIKRGMQEIASGQANSCSQSNTRIRKPGGGRKSNKTPLDRMTRANSEINRSMIEAETRASERIVDQDERHSPALTASDDSIQHSS